jgi:hypothetical protein
MMRRTLILTIAALAGLLLVWLLAVRPPAPPPALPAKTVVEAPPPVQSVTPPPPIEPVAAKPAEIVAKPPPTAESKPPEQKPTEPPTEQTADTSTDDANADTEDATDDSAADDTEQGGPPAIDTDHATDLLADMIARQEAMPEDDHSLPNAVVQTLKKFDQESADANWSQNAEQHIEASLGEWIDKLPEDAQAHLALIHVECHQTLCQVLAADNDPGSQGERSAAGQEWQQAMGSLASQPWWHELGFVDLSTQVSGSDDHTLYMSYLLREVKPAAVPDAQPDTGETDGGG